MRIVVLGLSLSSSWGNGHATTYRALLRAMARRGHDIAFLEREQPWYADHRDFTQPDFCRLHFYSDAHDLKAFRHAVANADAVIVGSYVADGAAIGRWVQGLGSGVTAFYDIDTPVTLAKLAAGDFEYLSPDLIPGYDPYLSFTGGPALETLERRHGAPAARVLYCTVDEARYRPLALTPRFDLGYLGTYSADRQPALERLLIEPARRAPDMRFVVAGPQFPDDIEWPANVTRFPHVGPADHAAFYSSCRFTLNVTRADMVRAGFSPSVRLFEAAACASPIISDEWAGIETIFTPGRDILLARDPGEVLSSLRDMPEPRRKALGEAGRRRVLAAHTAAHRAAELEAHLAEAMERRPSAARRPAAPSRPPHLARAGASATLQR
jgi:spore maturation protein CgeB